MDDFKKQADEEENKKERFKGKFIEVCAVNREGGWMRLIRNFEAGYDDTLHCTCHVCERQREEMGVERCVDRSCDGCKNLKNGVKIRDWYKDHWSREDAQRKVDNEG